MKSCNLFEGDSYKAQYARILYRELMTGKECTHSKIVHLWYADAGLKVPEKTSEVEGYKELLKAFNDIKKAIVTSVNEKLPIDEKVNEEDLFDMRGNNRKFFYRYTAKDRFPDPLAKMKAARVIDNLQEYWRFCQESAGFFPQSWINYFFKDSQDLINIKRRKTKGEQIIATSIDRDIKNIELLPELYEYIHNKQVIEFQYQPFGKDAETIVFHPQYIKEYNGRWFLYGHAEGHNPIEAYNIALDRIVSKIRTITNRPYIKTPTPTFYEDYFKDIIGVSNKSSVATETIIIRTHSVYIHHLIKTKPIHHSQEIIKDWDIDENAPYGEYAITVKYNNELLARLLSFGEDIEIISPDNIRNLIKEKIEKTFKLYK